MTTHRPSGWRGGALLAVVLLPLGFGGGGEPPGWVEATAVSSSASTTSLAGAGDRSPGTVHEERLVRRFALPAAGGLRTLAVDNVVGSIVVRGEARDDVELRLVQRWEGRDAAELARARAEVKLGVEERPGRLDLWMEAPFQCGARHAHPECSERRERGERGERRHAHRAYDVRFDFELAVPRRIDLELRDVLGEPLRVTGTEGRFDVAHVNAAVELDGVSGQGRAVSVNGGVRAGFARSPRGPLELESVNGDLELLVPPGFGAELSFRTLQGEVYTDLPAGVAAAATRVERAADGHRVALSARTVVRLGAGGPPLSCTTVNGDIVIRHASR